MTNQDKFLVAYPMAQIWPPSTAGDVYRIVRFVGDTDYIIGKTPEIAWKNAAESLPAQLATGFTDADDDAHMDGHARMILGEPVAPVEPKDKCERCGQPKDNGWRHNYESGYGDFATISCSAPVAEPKPTPSTPACLAPDGTPCPKCHPKPQPDSSSISSEAVAAEGKFDGFLFQIRKDIPEEMIQAGTKSGAYLILKFADPDSSSIPDEPDALKRILGVGQKFPDEQQRALDLVNQMKTLGEHQGKENAALLYAMDVIVDLLRVGCRDSSSISSEQTFRSDKDMLLDILYYCKSHSDNHPRFDASIREACIKLHGFDPDGNAAKGTK